MLDGVIYMPPPIPSLHELSLTDLNSHPVKKGFGAQERHHRETAAPEESRAPRSHGIYHQAQKLIAFHVSSFLTKGLGEARSVRAKENKRWHDF